VQGLTLLVLGAGDTFGEQVLGFREPEVVEEVSAAAESRRFVTDRQQHKHLALARQRRGNQQFARRLRSTRKVCLLRLSSPNEPLDTILI
jgi:hypothetical protein